eukprot:4103605-Pleurochrysis_carterae.AAC.5
MASAGRPGQGIVVATLVANARGPVRGIGIIVPPVLATPVSAAARHAEPPARDEPEEVEEGLPAELKGRCLNCPEPPTEQAASACFKTFLPHLLPELQKKIWFLCRNVKACTFGQTYTKAFATCFPAWVGKRFITWLQERFPRDQGGVRMRTPTISSNAYRVLHIASIMRPCQIKDLCSFEDAIDRSYGRGHVRVFHSLGDIRFVSSILVKYVEGLKNPRNNHAKLEVSICTWQVNGMTGGVDHGTGNTYSPEQWVQAVQCAKDVVESWPADDAWVLSSQLRAWPQRPTVAPPVPPAEPQPHAGRGYCSDV